MISRAVPRIGVIGGGYWGAKIARVCSELGMLESICESSPDARERMRVQHPRLPVVADVCALLARDIDAVAIATPPSTHADLALEAIAAGKHVFVEKPLALHAEDAATVVRAARAGGRLLFVGHLMLYHPAIRHAKALIRAGAVGEVRHVRTRRLAFGRLRNVENAWWSLAPHDVALVLDIFGGDPTAVTGTLHTLLRRDVADAAYADLLFENDRSAHIEVSWLDPHKSMQIDIFGSTGVLRFVDAPGTPTLSITPCGGVPGADGRPELWREDEHVLPFDAQEPLRVEMLAFAHALVTSEPTATGGDEAARVVNVLAALERAAASRHVMPTEALL